MTDYICPNPECKCHAAPEGKWYVKTGYFKTRWNHQPVPRYKCKMCGKTFSSHTFRDTYRQHRPDLNELVFNFYASNSSQNRLARNLNCDRKTVVRKVRWLAAKARRVHQAKLDSGEIKIAEAQFDEMETFEHTRKKPLSISLAVEVQEFKDKKTNKMQYRSGRIIDAKVASMPCGGHLAALSREKYGMREDGRAAAARSVLGSLLKASMDGELHVGIDGKTSYPNLFESVLPKASVEVISREKNKGSEYDPMFSLNHTCARIRHDLSRMARKSWVTTKNIRGLQDHLDLYVAYWNGYQL